jgi:hypothetical protein
MRKSFKLHHRHVRVMLYAICYLIFLETYLFLTNIFSKPDGDTFLETDKLEADRISYGVAYLQFGETMKETVVHSGRAV